MNQLQINWLSCPGPANNAKLKTLKQFATMDELGSDRYRSEDTQLQLLWDSNNRQYINLSEKKKKKEVMKNKRRNNGKMKLNNGKEREKEGEKSGDNERNRLILRK